MKDEVPDGVRDLLENGFLYLENPHESERNALVMFVVFSFMAFAGIVVLFFIGSLSLYTFLSGDLFVSMSMLLVLFVFILVLFIIVRSLPAYFYLYRDLIRVFWKYFTGDWLKIGRIGYRKVNDAEYLSFILWEKEGFRFPVVPEARPFLFGIRKDIYERALACLGEKSEDADVEGAAEILRILSSKYDVDVKSVLDPTYLASRL